MLKKERAVTKFISSAAWLLYLKEDDYDYSIREELDAADDMIVPDQLRAVEMFEVKTLLSELPLASVLELDRA